MSEQMYFPSEAILYLTLDFQVRLGADCCPIGSDVESDVRMIMILHHIQHLGLRHAHETFGILRLEAALQTSRQRRNRE